MSFSHHLPCAHLCEVCCDLLKACPFKEIVIKFNLRLFHLRREFFVNLKIAIDAETLSSCPHTKNVSITSEPNKTWLCCVNMWSEHFHISGIVTLLYVRQSSWITFHSIFAFQITFTKVDPHPQLCMKVMIIFPPLALQGFQCRPTIELTKTIIAVIPLVDSVSLW